MRRLPRTALALAVLACAAIGVHVAEAAFTDTETNPQTLQAAGTWPQPLVMSSGSYVGDGTGSRALRVTSFRPDLVIVRGDTNQVSVARTSTMPAGLSKPMVGASALASGLITSLDDGGFTIGAGGGVNTPGVIYYWTALQASGPLSVGSYTGTGAASRAVTGLGFQPEYAAVLGSGATRAVQRYAGMGRAYQFDADTGQASTRIASLNADGFTVGSSDDTGRSGDTYHYYAFNQWGGSVAVGSYTGSALLTRDITGIGFRPAYVSVRSDSTLISRAGAQRFSGQPGDRSFAFGGAGAAANLIEAFLDDGFRVGSDSSINALGITTYYLVTRGTETTCQQTGSYVFTSNASAHVEQASPLFNYGSAAQLKVKSHQSDNRRALLGFQPPAMDPECQVKSAKLVLTASTARPGRTLSLRRAAASWSEGVVTWSSQPSQTGTAVTAPSPAAAGATVEFDVTSDVQKIAAGTLANHGFVLTDATEGDASGAEHQFSSDDVGGSSAPRLMLEVGPAS